MLPADYALQAVKDIKEVFNNAVPDALEQYKDNRVIDMYDTSEVYEVFTSTEGLDGYKKLSGRETPPSLNLEDGYRVVLEEARSGGAIVVQESTYRRDKQDSTVKVDNFLMRQRDNLMKDGVNDLMVDAFSMLNNAFDSGAATLAPDSVELCGTHSWATGSTFTNAATAALDADAVDDLDEYAGDFSDSSSSDKPFIHDFGVIIVKKGSAAARTAKRLFAFGITPATVANINIYEGEKTIIETPYITTANKLKWFARDLSFRNSIVLGIGNAPTMREPQIQADESVRSNVTGFWKFGIVNMPHDIYGSTGAV